MGFNGGPSNCPAKPGNSVPPPHSSYLASMEGRAIARPNGGRGWCWMRRRMRFNGGPSNCPAKHARPVRRHRGAVASMEGRAIARPNRSASAARSARKPMLQWRAEQLPGQTIHTSRNSSLSATSLQWRAEQLPGQTTLHCTRRGPALRASMEGRAIARPNGVGPTGTGSIISAASMEGRAIARPNMLGFGVAAAAVAVLQWRAEQLPGQTVRSGSAHDVAAQASMEGRAIARPNL